MKKVRIDIVSDIVCPWCIIGYKRLEQALFALSHQIEADIHWHPFEINPIMQPEGDNLRKHLNKKYATTDKTGQLARESLYRLGKEVKFHFNFTPAMRIYNTRKAHQLLMWSSSQNKQLDLQLILFQAYFTDNLNISNEQVLMECVDKAGLDINIAQQILQDKSWADCVAITERQWLEAGISVIPAIIINKTHLILGAQTTELLISNLKQFIK